MNDMYSNETHKLIKKQQHKRLLDKVDRENKLLEYRGVKMENEEIDHEYTDNIICPYCGSEDTDSWECMPDTEDLGHIECWECEKKFLAQRLITIKYSTSKIDWLKEWKTWNKNAIFHNDAVRQLRADGYYKKHDVFDN